MLTHTLAVLRLILAALLLTALAGCGGPVDDPDAGPVVLAASSLQESLEEVAAAWEADGHAAPVLSFASSSSLARQIGLGAPADLFLSADQAWMDALAGRNLLAADPQTRVDLLSNRLVLVARKGATAGSLAELGDGKLAVADPAAVPAGKYARAALERRGRWRTISANVVPAENVRAALALVERGEAALGIVYATDALASDAVEVLETFPEGSHPPIRYPMALLGASKHPAARGFFDFVQSAEAARIFERHGFGVVEDPFGNRS